VPGPRSSDQQVRRLMHEDRFLYTLKVYRGCMTRTNIDIDDELVADVIRRYGLSSKREAVDLALRRLAGPKITPEFALSLEGIGWEGDLDEIRRQSVVEW